jgi:antitoxin CptB
MKEGQIRWYCRRGMKELDDLLVRFCDQYLDQLKPDERAAFIQLLELQDPVLMDYLGGRMQPTDKAQTYVIKWIRDSARICD